MRASSGVGSIVLIGFMGTGKSSVGRRVAKRIGAHFLDTDQLVKERMKLTIPEIFERLGEDRFREEETAVLREIDRTQRFVVSTGGGIILRSENVALLRAIGPVVCLHANPEAVFERVSRRSHRPLLQTSDPRATVIALLEKREPHYRAAADVVINTSAMGQDEAADAVLREVELLAQCRTAH